MRKSVSIVPWLVLTMMLSACAAFAPAQSFEQRLAYAYGVHTAVQTAAANSVTNKELTSAQGKQVLDLADESRRVLDAAKLTESAGDVRTAEGQLKLATSILTELQAYLRRSS